jgi:aryl-alcohol dehydrogenase-like predicted oxidoreductase
MVASVRLSKAGIVTSRLAFGTSRLHYIGHRERQRLLATAAALGFMHFDTSPAYGDGLAETELGQFVGGQRDGFVVATKYGIPADPIMERCSSFVPSLQIAGAFARRIGFRRHQMPPLTAAGLRESAERSLRRLKTDHIDILLLHEPRLERLSRPGEVLREVEKLKQRGLIRAFGLAGAWSGISAILRALPELGQVVQTAEAEWPATCFPEITYGALTGGSQNYLATGIGNNMALERLRSAVIRRPNGVVIVSTTKIRNLHVLAEATR